MSERAKIVAVFVANGYAVDSIRGLTSDREIKVGDEMRADDGPLFVTVSRTGPGVVLDPAVSVTFTAP